jgi:hypothetical protein
MRRLGVGVGAATRAGGGRDAVLLVVVVTLGHRRDVDDR